MNLRTYQKAKRYAVKIKYSDPIDLVHDSYLMWYEKTGQDLFDEPEGRVMSILWKVCNNYIRRNQWMYEGTRYPKVYVTYEEGTSEKIHGTTHKYNAITPEDYCIGNDLKERFSKVVKSCDPLTRQILKYKWFGYNNTEISQEMNIAMTTLSKHIKRSGLNGIRDI